MATVYLNHKNNLVLVSIFRQKSPIFIYYQYNGVKVHFMSNVFEYESNGMFKYAVGNCVTMDEAIELQKKVKAKVYNDAFIVAFYKGERVSVKKAKQLIKEGKQ